MSTELSTGTITAAEAARLMRAVLSDQKWKRGKKNRMECWKVIYGIYVNIRFKDPRVSIEGRSWRADFQILSGLAREDYYSSRPTPKNSVTIPVPYSAPREVQMVLEALHGEDAYHRDMLLLRMFESEWEQIAGRGV